MQARTISGGVHYHGVSGPGSPPEALPKPQQLPGDVRGFVNRVAEIEQLDAVLATSGDDPLVVSVCVIAGTAGAGKTSLALRWAHQIKERFPDGQLYINLRGYDPGEPVTARDALYRFLSALGVRPEAVPRDDESAAALYRSLLGERRMLVVLDNASSPGQVRPLVPGTGGSMVLVTSRSRLAGLAVRDGARRLTLGTLPAPEAVALLRAVTAGYRGDDDSQKLEELARLCADLPLALRIAAERAASNPHMGIDELIAELRDESALWDALSTGDDEEADAVRTVFAWSYRALTERAARLFCLLGLHPGPEWSLPAAAALAGLPVPRTRQLLDSLVNAHLVEQIAPDRYQFHDLLRAYASDQARHEESEEDRRAALRRVLVWYLNGAAAAGSRLMPGGSSGVVTNRPADGPTVEFPDHDAAAMWADREHPALLAAVDAAADLADDRLVGEACVAAYEARPRAGNPAGWLRVADSGLAAARRLGDRGLEGVILEYQGMSHTWAGAYERGLASYRAALALFRESGDQRRLARSLNQVGLSYLHLRQLSLAEQHFEEALARCLPTTAAEDTPPDPPRFAATIRANIAETLLRAGELSAAAQHAAAAAAAHRDSGDRPGHGNALHLLSAVRREEGRLEEALALAQQAVETAWEIRDDRREAYWLITLGQAQLAMGKLADALETFQRSSLLHRRTGAPGREARGWQGAAKTYLAEGREREAADFFRRAAHVHEVAGDRWHRALALDGLARAIHADDPPSARRHWAEAVELLADYTDPRAAAAAQRFTAAARAAE